MTEHSADDAAVGIEVPPEQLSPEALRAVVESFVLREGTDYGEREYALGDKVEQVMRQLARGEARIMFDPEAQSIQIVASNRTRGAHR
jgi:uncharacterized protein YheU (UPF0270 family)